MKPAELMNITSTNQLCEVLVVNLFGPLSPTAVVINGYLSPKMLLHDELFLKRVFVMESQDDLKLP